MKLFSISHFCTRALIIIICFSCHAIYAAEAEHLSNPADSDSSKTIIRNSILIGTVPVTFLFGVKAWDWSGDHSFYSKNEGWFSKSTDYAGADKAGHFFAHYVVQRSMYDIFSWTENNQSSKWVYSIGTTMTLGLLIEVGDGFSSKYGFSFQDLTMDYTGILCGAVLDRFPLLNNFLGISSTFIPTDGFINRYNRHNGIKASLEFVNDYSGWRTMVNFKLAGFEKIGFHLPLALRLIQFDVGYYTRGYSNYDKGHYSRPHTRDICYGISLNSAQLLEESVSSDSRGTTYSVAHRALEYYHIPIEKKKSADF